MTYPQTARQNLIYLMVKKWVWRFLNLERPEWKISNHPFRIMILLSEMIDKEESDIFKYPRETPSIVCSSSKTELSYNIKLCWQSSPYPLMGRRTSWWLKWSSCKRHGDGEHPLGEIIRNWWGKRDIQKLRNNSEVVAGCLSLAYTKIIILRDIIQSHFTNLVEIMKLAISTM